EYNKTHYQKNKKLHIKRAVKRKIAMRLQQTKQINELKDQVPCTDCGIPYPYYIMDFDHIKGKKIANVSDMTGRFGWDKIQKEINKCEIVCSNCHRQRTWERNQSMVQSGSMAHLE